jgi:hypothetical protein
MNSEKITYTYFRSTSIIEDEDLGELFLGFVALSTMNEHFSGNIKRQKLTAGPGFYKECPLREVPIQLSKLPHKDQEIFLTQNEYELLEKSADQDELAFWLYRTAIS